MNVENDLRGNTDRIEALLADFAAAGDPQIRAKAEELVRLLMEMYGSGLARLLEIVDEVGGAAVDPLFECLGSDRRVSDLLLLHGLHPIDVHTRVQRALDEVRPYLGSHGGDVKLLGIEEGVVRLRLEGSCKGCPSSTVTMKLAVEQAIEKAAPDIVAIEVEGGVDGETAEEPPADEYVSIGSGAHRSTGAAPLAPPAPESAGWIALGAPETGPGGLAALDLSGARVVMCKVDEAWYAYRDVCPSCGSLLAGGTLDQAVLRCPSCDQRYDVRRAGGSVDEGRGLHLDPLPLLQEEGAIKIAVPAGPGHTAHRETMLGA